MSDEPDRSATPLQPSEVATDRQLRQMLIGSWRITDALRDGQPSDVHYGVVTIKHITPSGFVWLSYDPSDRQMFRSMGGSWSVSEGRYIEKALYGMHENFLETRFGRVVSIDVDVTDDVLTQTITSRSGSKFVEIWKRIRQGEDPIMAAKPGSTEPPSSTSRVDVSGDE